MSTFAAALRSLSRPLAASLALTLVPCLALAQTAPAKKSVKHAAADTSARASGTGSQIGDIWVGGGAGIAPAISGTPGVFTWKLYGEIDYVATRLAPGVDLEVVGTLAPVRYGSTSQTAPIIGASASTSIYYLDLYPEARVVYGVAPQWSVYGGLGLGITYYSATAKLELPGFPTQEATSSGVSGLLHLGLGGRYEFSKTMRVDVQVVGLNFALGGDAQSNYTFQVGLGFKI